ncbi:acylphosphatase AcyP [Mycobacterium tuberculosis]|nr:acylphosphatase AcyP [Mycobacterium tuberculosis]
MSAEDKERLVVVVNRAIDLVCTVGRTLKSGTKVTFEVSDVGT